ncbi:MAG: RNA 2',3'-cyclic phosphodiesterase [Methanothrix sp.]|uniref:RNA 2',3'-cyclic phosphodiesterase n=1 Tax=Methanothrix sp. TaxID=90426 RepID=UPI003BB66AC7
MTGIRCFVAVDLPEEMREEIGRLEEGIATAGLRLVRPELVHITIKFLGDVPEGGVGRVKEALATVKAAPFAARLTGMGAFPGRSVRVVWLGLEGDFTSLSDKVEAALGPLGYPREERGFIPHVTIGRVGRPNARISRELLAKIGSRSALDLGSFTVDRFYLKKSTLTPGGPIYEDLAAFPL